MTEDIAVPVHHASLPGCIGIELGRALAKSEASIRDDQTDAGEPTFLEVFEE